MSKPLSPPSAMFVFTQIWVLPFPLFGSLPPLPRQSSAEGTTAGSYPLGRSEPLVPDSGVSPRSHEPLSCVPPRIVSGSCGL